MHSKPLSTTTTWAFLLTLATASPFFKERAGKYTFYKRDSSALDSLITRDDAPFFPFPANQSYIVDPGSQSDPPPGNLTVGNYTAATVGSIPRKFIKRNCDAGKKRKIINSWAEANLLAKAQTSLRPGYPYDIPHSQWLGPNWNSEASWFPWMKNYRKLIGDNFGRLAKLYSNNAPSHDYIYWYCYDPYGGCKKDANRTAYSFDQKMFWYTNHYTIFCDPFYDLPTLGDQTARWANDKAAQMVMENFYLNSGHIMFWATWLYETLVSNPRAGAYTYNVESAWNYTKKWGTSGAYVNADSYALDALAIYVQQYYKSSMSPVPRRELPKFDAGAAAATSQPPDDNVTWVTMTDTPPGWVWPLSNTETPDMSVWEEVYDDGSTSSPQQSASATPLSTDAKLTCTGDNTTKWMDRDALNSVIGTFCGDAEMQGVQDPNSASLVRNYTEGGPQAVSLSIDWPSGSSFKPKKADCIGYMTTIMDSCDRNDPQNNPMNWKHGGYNQVGDERYNVNPMTERYKSGVCAVHVHEKEYFSGRDGLDTERSHIFNLTVDAKDADGKIIGGTYGKEVEAGQKGRSPYKFEGYYSTLEITPEAQSNNYIQFTIGSQSWTTKDNKVIPRCQTGDWDGSYSPVSRDMDCFFNC
ncbi:MAG: hypothetical protein Q9175_007814 [Cornicularia normoerica]